MPTNFFIIGLPSAFTSEQLQQVLAAETEHLRTAEMLPDHMLPGVAYVDMDNRESVRRALRKFYLMEQVFGIRLLICERDSASFHFLFQRWETRQAHAA